MKIYETRTAPNARRVRMFLAEKDIDMEYVQVDIEKGENLGEDYRRKNPTTKVPVLELDDGSYIGESAAICRYFEALHPENPLMGSTPREKAEIEMWHRQVEFYFLLPVAMCFQHVTGYFKDRMTPVAAYGEECGKQAVAFLERLNERLRASTYLAGEDFSIADILALCTLDFARVVKIRPDDSHTHIARWYEQVNSRPSARA